MECRMNKIYAKDADSLLLQEVRRIPQVDVQQNVVRLSTGLELKSQAHPTVGLICSGIVACGDGIDKREKARLRPASFLQLFEELSPLAIEHGFQALF